jgi:hypothetical protein
MKNPSSWKPKTAELAFAVVLAVIPLSFSMEVKWRCVLWFISWALVLHIIFSRFLRKLSLLAKTALGIAATVILVGCLFNPVHRMWAAEQSQRSTGGLSADEAIPGVKPGLFCMKIGFRSQAATICKDPHEGKGFVNALGDLLTLKDVDGRASLTTKVRDADGNLIVEVSNNHWRVAKDDRLVWDKNYTSNRLEVLDGKGLVVLSVQLFTNGMRIQGDWHNEYAQDVRIFQDGNGNGSVEAYGTGALIPRNEISRQFKYPSRDNLGE